MMKGSSLSRTVFKATSLFGGTQLVSLLGSVVRTKLIAIWIGEAGIGLFGMLNAAVDMIGSLTQLGVRSSAVRDVSELDAAANKSSLGHMVKAIRRWGLWLGLLGVAVMMVVAPLLAISTYDDSRLIWPFMLLAIVLLLNSVTEAEKAVLQGRRRFRELAAVMLWSVVVGCIASVPMIYYWRLDSVAPVILAYSAIGFAIMRIYRRKGDATSEPQSMRETLNLGRRFMKLGFYMTISGVLTYASNYIFLAFMNLTAGTDAVGAYQAGYTLSVKYVGFLFTAIGVEYYPRLAAVASVGTRRLATFMRHEIVLLSSMTGIAAALMVLFAPFIVQLFYSAEFEPTVMMIQLAAPGLLLRAASWCIAFVILARGDGALYFRCELASVVIGLLLNLVAFHYYGVEGVGASFTLWYLAYFAIVYTAIKRRYRITLGRRVSTLLLLLTLLLLAITTATLTLL